MKNAWAVLLLVGSLMPTLCAQSSVAPTPMLIVGYNSAGPAFIPVTTAASGPSYPVPPPKVTAYGYNSGLNQYFPLAVDTNGNQMVAPGSTLTNPTLLSPSLGATGLSIAETVSFNGTTQNLAVTYDTNTGNVQTMAINGLGFLGFATTTQSSGNTVNVCYIGTCSCIADNTVTAGDLLGAGQTTAGRCHDLGVQNSSTVLGNVPIWGKAQTGGAAGSTILINDTGPGHFGQSINNSMSTTPLTITGATPTYSFDSQGTNAYVVALVSGGAISSILTWEATGAGYAVGDLITVGGGNNDSVIQITAVSSGRPTAGTILYGGTGYIATGAYSTQTPTNSYAFTFILSGALTQNVQFIMTNGTFLTQSNQWIWINNTTGGFLVNVCVAGATDACSGGSTVNIPPGTGTLNPVFVQTDGKTNVTFANSGMIPSASVTLTAAASDSFTVPGVSSASHCTFSPTNSTAAAITALAYISSLTANTVTLTHATTASGGTENLVCTLY